MNPPASIEIASSGSGEAAFRVPPQLAQGHETQADVAPTMEVEHRNVETLASATLVSLKVARQSTLRKWMKPGSIWGSSAHTVAAACSASEMDEAANPPASMELASSGSGKAANPSASIEIASSGSGEAANPSASIEIASSGFGEAAVRVPPQLAQNH